MTFELKALLAKTARRHDHLCPRQVLGVRMGLAGLEAVSLAAPLAKTSGLVIVETDGCFVDGIEVSTGASTGHRTLRINDMGKLAATFVDVQTGQSIRLAARPDSRRRAHAYAQATDDLYASQLEGYQVMPDDELFRFQEVVLDPRLEAVLSRPGIRVLCDSCGEEIINEREVRYSGIILCQSCAGAGYYRPACDQMDFRATKSVESI